MTSRIEDVKKTGRLEEENKNYKGKEGESGEDGEDKEEEGEMEDQY